MEEMFVYVYYDDTNRRKSWMKLGIDNLGAHIVGVFRALSDDNTTKILWSTSHKDGNGRKGLTNIGRLKK